MTEKYLIFDTETGGTNPNKHALLSLGAILVDGELNEIERYYTLINDKDPFHYIEEEATRINHITRTLVEQQGIPMAQAIYDFHQLAKGVTGFIGHNVKFDFEFINANGFNQPEIAFDTVHMAWDIWRDESANVLKPIDAKLSTCYMRIGLVPEDAHNALGDCEMVHTLLRWAVERGHVSLPLPIYTVYPYYYRRYAFGYDKLLEMDLVKRVK